MSAFLHTGPSEHSLIPRLQRWELVDINTSPESSSNPALVCNIGDSTFVANQVARGGFLELGIEHAVETTGFIDIALYAVFDWSELVEIEI